MIGKYEVCFKCKLSLPRVHLRTAIIQRGNQKARVFVCDACDKVIREQIKKQQPPTR